MVTSTDLSIPKSTPATRDEVIVRIAEARMSAGFAPPPEIYEVRLRNRINWGDYPAWAQPVDPELFEGCCHEG